MLCLFCFCLSCRVFLLLLLWSTRVAFYSRRADVCHVPTPETDDVGRRWCGENKLAITSAAIFRARRRAPRPTGVPRSRKCRSKSERGSAPDSCVLPCPPPGTKSRKELLLTRRSPIPFVCFVFLCVCVCVSDVSRPSDFPDFDFPYDTRNCMK